MPANIAECTRRVYERDRPDYRYLLVLLDRHINMQREKANDLALCSNLARLSGAKKVAAPAAKSSPIIVCKKFVGVESIESAAKR